MSDFTAGMTAAMPNVQMFSEPSADAGLESAIGDALGVDDAAPEEPATSDEPNDTPQQQAAPETDDAMPDVDAEPEAEPNESDSEPEPQDPAQENKQATPEQSSARNDSEIPEGVKVRNIDGKPRWTLDPEVGKATFARAALVDKATEILGEPLTEEALKFRQDAVESTEHMRTDRLSDDPQDQGRVFQHFEEMIQAARQRGEIGHDAMHGLVRTALRFGISSADTATRDAVVRDVLEFAVDDAYNQALAATDPTAAAQMWAAAQHLEQRNFGKFRPSAEFEQKRKDNPPSAQQARFQRPPAQNPRPQQEAQAQPLRKEFEQWTGQTNQQIRTDAVDKAVSDAVSHIAPALREKHPIVFQSLRDRLLSEVNKGLKDDASLQAQVTAATKRARLATNPELRNKIATEIIQRHAARAAQILNIKKGPILSEFADVFAAKSSNVANRVQAGKTAARTVSAPSGPSASRQHRQAPTSNTFRSSQDFTKELDQAFA